MVPISLRLFICTHDGYFRFSHGYGYHSSPKTCKCFKKTQSATPRHVSILDIFIRVGVTLYNKSQSTNIVDYNIVLLIYKV